MDDFAPLKFAIAQMIEVSEAEVAGLLKDCYQQSYKRKALVNTPFKICNEVLFVKKGILRVYVINQEGEEVSIHFALENEFIADYASFLQKTISIQHLQALEPTELIIMPRKAIEWGYENLRQGDKLGRLIAEYYFIYFDNRITNTLTKSPKERYDAITQVFPDIHNRVPQHMIASYLGISSVHLSRLKKEDKA